MEAQGIPVTIANLAIHRHREEEMNQERMRYDQILQEAAAQQAREANKGKTREVVPDSEEEEGSKELHSSASEEWKWFFFLRNPLESLLCDFFMNVKEELQSVKLRMKRGKAVTTRTTYIRDAIREAWRHKKPIETELPCYTSSFDYARLNYSIVKGEELCSPSMRKKDENRLLSREPRLGA
ncbi:hypothetical protein PIB30_057806, partial [Stylosanthes scabra]|nr:hypothetical protein [Stylosanthes scabra]